MLSRRGNLIGAFFVFACSPRAADPPPEGLTSVGAAPVTPLPCDVAQVLHDRCWDCHGPTLQYTAPMHLTSWEDTQAPSKGDPSKPIYVRIGERLHDVRNLMPPASWPVRPTAADIAVLDRWIAAGGPAGDGTQAACQPPGSPAGASGSSQGGNSASGAGGSAGIVGASSGSGGVNASGGPSGSGGVNAGPPPLADGGYLPPEADGGDLPVEPSPSECTTVSMHARKDASGAPFPVPTGEGYYCFSFHVPFSGKTQGLGFYKHIDNTQVIHHWLLYKMVTPQFDGLAIGCVGFHADGALLAGWAPGGSDWFLPKDVGMDLGGGDFILEVHYSNTGAATTDSSGVDVCTTTNLRTHTAGLFWLGTMDINIPAGGTGTAQSHCTPQIQEPLHVLRSWPHMHKLGRHLTTEVVRAGSGVVEPVVDLPFDFNSQNQYNTPLLVYPGDRLDTTCSYDNTHGPSSVGFGESTTSEMCFDFTVAYPDTADLPGGNTPNGCNN